MTKELDFFLLLKAWNDYDHWLSDKLCSLDPKANPSYDDGDYIEKYNVFKECRQKLQDILDEVTK